MKSNTNKGESMAGVTEGKLFGKPIRFGTFDVYTKPEPAQKQTGTLSVFVVDGVARWQDGENKTPVTREFKAVVTCTVIDDAIDAIRRMGGPAKDVEIISIVKQEPDFVIVAGEVSSLLHDARPEAAMSDDELARLLRFNPEGF